MTKPLTAADIVAQIYESVQYMATTIESNLKGRYVKVLTDFNGQPFGKSKPSWKGEVRKIVGAYVDCYNGVALCLEGYEYECYIPADQVELV